LAPTLLFPRQGTKTQQKRCPMTLSEEICIQNKYKQKLYFHEKQTFPHKLII